MEAALILMDMIAKIDLLQRVGKISSLVESDASASNATHR
jgi:hypothetical protein